MQHTYTKITDLPDELLIMIFKRLNNIEILQFLMNVNTRFNKIVRDSTFTNHLTLLKCSFNHIIYSLSDTILDKFCIEIIPQIKHNIKWLDIESLSMERILLAAKYPNLNGLGIFNINEEVAQRLFIEENRLNSIFKQITRLVITFANSDKKYMTDEERINIFTYILNIFINIRYLKLYTSSQFCIYHLSFENYLPTFFSSTLIELHICVLSFSACLYLLDGRFNQLQTLIVTIDWIVFEKTTINNNKGKLPNLRYFSLTCNSGLCHYNGSVLPLLHRMINLKKLSLYIVVNPYEQFIDGNNLKKYILDHIPQLNEFTFNIRSIIYDIDNKYLLTNEQIQNTFTNFIDNKIISCVDYFPKKQTG
ncbi:unnamed protein product [Rotaria sordida]|uniref:F-box domain-containing protein n=1 Tax=Rotaria sordida TaxID=392033 RepID=A0A815WEY4_9BILA|nr:unnamed protein product [Rotaria sordida]CAF1543088.1 unnamed protein product [Rotaria sordida]